MMGQAEPLTVEHLLAMAQDIHSLKSVLPPEVEVRITTTLPFLREGRGWVHYLLVDLAADFYMPFVYGPERPKAKSRPVLAVSPFLFHLIKYNKANKLMRSKARWWFR